MREIFVSTSTFSQWSPEPLELLERAGLVAGLNPTGRKLEPAETIALVSGKIGLIAGTEELGRDVLEQLTGLKVISRCGVGVDAVDLDAAQELGIRVLRTSSSHVPAVAELTLAGILSLLRRTALADRNLRATHWNKPMGNLLRGKTVALVGFGRTGQALARLLEPFDTPVLAVDPNPTGFDTELPFDFVPLSEALQRADIVSLHLEYSPELRHMIGTQELKSMKPGALVVNTARGGLIDEEGLLAELTEGSLGGAYLDVFEREPYDGPLRELDNTLLTPHIGSYAAEARVAMEIEAAQNVIEALGLEAPGVQAPGAPA